jgi:hypothetical protein
MALAEATNTLINFPSPVQEALHLNELARRRVARNVGGFALERVQAEDDATTQLAEWVDGSMYVEFELTLQGDDLYSRDGRNIGEVTLNGLRDAREAAKKNPNLWFEVGRSSIEREEYLEAVDMAKGNGPNTMFISSDYPEDLRDADEDVGGYNRIRQQAMERSFTRNSDGTVTMRIKSLDGSNREALEAVHAEFGQVIHKGPMLGQRARLNLSPEEQDRLMDRAVDTYDRKMAEQFGGEWYAGRRPADYRNTYDFVCQQADLVEMWVNADLNGNLTDTLMYDIAAAAQARFEKNQVEQPLQQKRRLGVLSVGVAHQARLEVDPAALQYELRSAGAQARAEDKVFSGCGVTLKATGKDESTEAQMDAAGYANQANKEKLPWYGRKKFKNAKCVSCNKVKNEVGSCHICQDCVAHPKKHALGTVQGRTPDPEKAKAKDKPAEVVSLDKFRQAKTDKANKAV